MTSEEAIKRIHRFVEIYKICGKDNYNPTTNITKLDYEAFKSAIESLKQMESILNKSEILTGWIPVSERLPKENISVIGTTKYDDIYKTELYDDCGEKKWYADGNFDVPIVAWLPLPSSYQGE